MRRGWTDLLRSLGESLIGVAGAEAAALKGDLRASGRQFAIVVALAATAALLCFWLVGAAWFVLFQVLTLWLPNWGAAAIVFAVGAILALLVAMVTRQRLRSIELPVDTVRRHFDDHLAWWDSQMFPEKGQSRERLPEDPSRDQKGIPDES